MYKSRSCLDRCYPADLNKTRGQSEQLGVISSFERRGRAGGIYGVENGEEEKGRDNEDEVKPLVVKLELNVAEHLSYGPSVHEGEIHPHKQH